MMIAPTPPITATPNWFAPAPKLTTMIATSRPSRTTPLKARNQAVQSTPGPLHSSASPCGSLPPIPASPRAATRMMPLRNHCRPKTSSNAPITKRRGPIGTTLSAAPRITTTTASTPKPDAAPINVERQPRVAPTPTTMVTISIASTAEARKVVIRTTAVPLICDSLPGFAEPGRIPSATTNRAQSQADDQLAVAATGRPAPPAHRSPSACPGSACHPPSADPQDALLQVETLVDDARDSPPPRSRRLDSGWE